MKCDKQTPERYALGERVCFGDHQEKNKSTHHDELIPQSASSKQSVRQNAILSCSRMARVSCSKTRKEDKKCRQPDRTEYQLIRKHARTDTSAYLRRCRRFALPSLMLPVISELRPSYCLHNCSTSSSQNSVRANPFCKVNFYLWLYILLSLHGKKIEFAQRKKKWMRRSISQVSTYPASWWKDEVREGGYNAGSLASRRTAD